MVLFLLFADFNVFEKLEVQKNSYLYVFKICIITMKYNSFKSVLYSR